MARRKLPTPAERRRIVDLTGAGEETVRRAYNGECPTRSIVYGLRAAAAQIGAPLPPWPVPRFVDVKAVRP